MSLTYKIAVLVFLDSTNPDPEQLDALDLLLTELRRPTPGTARLARPLALIASSGPHPALYSTMTTTGVRSISCQIQ